MIWEETRAFAHTLMSRHSTWRYIFLNNNLIFFLSIYTLSDGYKCKSNIDMFFRVGTPTIGIKHTLRAMAIMYL